MCVYVHVREKNRTERERMTCTHECVCVRVCVYERSSEQDRERVCARERKIEKNLLENNDTGVGSGA